MKTIECPKCRKVVNVEPEHNGFNKVNSGHGRIIDPWRRPTELQCACGQHIVLVIASPQFKAA